MRYVDHVEGGGSGSACAFARRIKDSQGGHGRPSVEIPAFGGGGRGMEV